MMETQRLLWVRNNQSKLRVGKYRKLTDDHDGAPKIGKRVVLPSTFVGGKRYMDGLYFDGMAISGSVGFPDLFITFTCNPNWPEIVRLVSKTHLKPHDRPDIIARVFKIKLDELMKDLTKKHILGRVVAYMYTIEFQKRGLPHAHILLFLHPSSKYPTPHDIDKIISAEIPDENSQPKLYNLDPSQRTTEQVDEIKQYLDCRYVSPSEACWRIFSFPIHARRPAVERLYFHLLGEHSVYYNDDDRVEDILLKPSVTESMFTA
ncbi:helicase-like protein, partial [Trifolium medium]|nr:helicase-like protein [Trifolium medium]